MPDTYVILVRTEFESTIGLVARAMKNFELKGLRLVSPVAEVGREARMRASHAQEVLDQAQSFRTLKEALAGVDISVGTTAQRSRSEYKILRRPVTPRELGESLRDAAGTAAVIFGPEGTGLSNDELSECDIILTILASDGYRTLNISHAAAIVFYELYTLRGRDSGDILARAEVKERIQGFIEDVSETAGLPGQARVLVSRAFKNVMGRSALRAREASLLAGFFRKISTQLSSPSTLERAKVTAYPVDKAVDA